MANPIPPLPLKTPMVDQRGLMTPTWVAWFRELFNRVGGTTASNNTDLGDSIDSAQTDLETLQAQVEALQQGRQL